MDLRATVAKSEHPRLLPLFPQSLVQLPTELNERHPERQAPLAHLKHVQPPLAVLGLADVGLGHVQPAGEVGLQDPLPVPQFAQELEQDRVLGSVSGLRHARHR